MTRKEIYQFIKENDLGSSIYELYGRSYTTISTEKLDKFVENRKEKGNQLTTEEVSDVLAEKIPVKLRVKSVYVPIIGLYAAMNMLDDTLSGLKGLGGQTSKKCSRKIRETIQEYDSILYRSMKPDLYKVVKGVVDEFMNIPTVSKYINILRFSLLQEALNRGFEQDSNTSVSVELILCRVFINFALTLDKRFSELLNEKCGVLVQYETTEDGRAKDIMDSIDTILNDLHVEKFESKNTKLCEDILFNELDNMEVWNTLSQS